VLDVLRETISAKQFDHVFGQLPSEYKRLFTAGSEGKMRLNQPRVKAAHGKMVSFDRAASISSLFF